MEVQGVQRKGLLRPEHSEQTLQDSARGCQTGVPASVLYEVVQASKWAKPAHQGKTQRDIADFPLAFYNFGNSRPLYVSLFLFSR